LQTLTWILLCWLVSSIEGRLWNPISGSPVRKADVVVGTLSGEPVKRAITDVNGHYLVEGLPPGRYRVAAGRAGFIPTLSPTIVISKADERRQDVNLAMDTPAVITGHVFDKEGEPLEGIAVAALSRNEASGAVNVLATTRTNDMGEYRFADLMAGVYVIHTARTAAPVGEVFSPAFYPEAGEWGGASPVRVGLGGEAHEINIRVSKGELGSIAGAVSGPGPVKLTLARKSTDAVMLALMEADITAAPDGRFLFPGLASGTYVVMAEAKHLWGSAEVTVNGTEAHSDIALRPTGIILAESNAPVHAFLVRGNRYRSEASVGGAVTFRFTFSFEDITPGTWVAEVEPATPDQFVESVKWGQQEVFGRPFEIGDQPWPVLRIKVSRGGTLEGKGASVSLISESVPESGGKTLEAIAGNDGRYRVRGIRPGKYRLSCSGELLEIGAGALVKRDCKP